MEEITNADNERTDTKRFDADDAPFDASDLIEGDRIEPSLVARTIAGHGTKISAKPDAPDAQLSEATITDSMEDVHTAILVDCETGVMVRASRHDSQAAWSQKEADWKVHDTGSKIRVTNVEWDDPEVSVDDDKEVTAWAEVVLRDRAYGWDNYNDEITLNGRSITLYNPYESDRAHGTVQLSDD